MSCGRQCQCPVVGTVLLSCTPSGTFVVSKCLEFDSCMKQFPQIATLTFGLSPHRGIVLFTSPDSISVSPVDEQTVVLGTSGQQFWLVWLTCFTPVVSEEVLAEIPGGGGRGRL